MQVRLEGVGRWMDSLTRLNAGMDTAAGLATTAAAHEVEKRTKQTLTTSSHRKDEPTPSQPGEPPSLVTSTLRRSLRVSSPIRRGFGDYESQVGPTVIYGRIQELGGTIDNAFGRGGQVTLPARPYLEPSLRAAIDDGSLAETYRLFWRRFWRV